MTVPNLVVVLLCVIGAGAVVVVGAAFGKQFVPRIVGSSSADDDPEASYWNQRSPEQDAYLKQVRDMNQMSIFAQVRRERAQAPRTVNYDDASGYTGAYNQGRYSTDHTHSYAHDDQSQV